jgi:hypothetical protein
MYISRKVEEKEDYREGDIYQEHVQANYNYPQQQQPVAYQQNYAQAYGRQAQAPPPPMAQPVYIAETTDQQRAMHVGNPVVNVAVVTIHDQIKCYHCGNSINPIITSSPTPAIICLIICLIVLLLWICACIACLFMCRERYVCPRCGAHLAYVESRRSYY